MSVAGIPTARQAARTPKQPSPQASPKPAQTAPASMPAVAPLIESVGPQRADPRHRPAVLRCVPGTGCALGDLEADHLLHLQRLHGNRHVLRMVARDMSARSVTDERPTADSASKTGQTEHSAQTSLDSIHPPALSRKSSSASAGPDYADEPLNAAVGATPENLRLGQAIDALNDLKDSELTHLREIAVVEATRPDGDDQERRRRTVEAIRFLADRPAIRDLLIKEPPTALDAMEFLAKRRGLLALQLEKDEVSRTKPIPRRLNVRVVIEEGIRKTGSFKKSLAGMPQPDYIEPDIRFFKKQAEAFKVEFRGQARVTADRMLDESSEAIGKVLKSYGVPPHLATGGAREIVSGHSDVRTQAKAVVEAMKGSEGIDETAKVKHRVDLKLQAGELKKHQRTVKELVKMDSELFERWRNDRASWTKALDERAREVDKELTAARSALKGAWIEAERHHPVLAAYRRGGELENIDLGKMDTDPVDRRMEAVMVQVLPKIVKIGEAKGKLQTNKNFALTLPSVVALTRANMFIPEGSIRAGVVNDLVAAAKGDDDFIKIAALALALITLVPSGGASLAIPAGMAAAGLAAYSVTKEWEHYKTKKTLANTDLDLARSLSAEEPTLTAFAVSLVELGLEGLPLVGAFNKARKLKSLVGAGEETADVVADLNRIGAGAPNKVDDLGNRALQEVRKDAKEGVAEGVGVKTGAPSPVGPTAVKPSKAKPGGGKLQTGHQQGTPIEKATPEEIAEGSVRMEQDPRFADALKEMKDAGYELRSVTKGSPHLVHQEVVGPDGEVLRVEKYIVAVEGMRFLDLEHEIGHMRQMIVNFKGKPPPSARVIETPRGQMASKNLAGTLTMWQNAIVEYHNRLVEWLRLHGRGARPELLREHAGGVAEWRQKYGTKGLKGGRSKSQKEWADEHFPDIEDLYRRYKAAGGLDYEAAAGRARE